MVKQENPSKTMQVISDTITLVMYQNPFQTPQNAFQGFEGFSLA